MTTKTAFLARPYAGAADLQPICDLRNLCTARDRVTALYETPALIEQDMADPNLDVAHDVRLWADAAGRLVGYGQIALSRPGDGDVVDALLRLAVHPEVRRQGLEAAIIHWAAERGRVVAGQRGQPAWLKTYFREGTPAYSADRRGILEAAGFVPVRTALRMACPLDPPLPEPQVPAGFTLRTVAGATEAALWTECYNQSFIDLWNHHPLAVEDCLRELNDPMYNRELDLVAVTPDGTFAAFCHSVIDRADNAHYQRKHGEIDALGTRRGYRKLGLGRAMLLAGMQRIKAAGMDTAVLWVDAENPSGARRLYESVGFTAVATNVTYRKDL